jgi:hypothetical protein
MRHYKETVEIDKETSDWLKHLLSYEEMTEEDFEKEEIGWDRTIYEETVEFKDGKQADIKVCSGQHNLWAEAVLFSKDGDELCFTDPEFDGIVGEWHMQTGSAKYTITVKEVA